jgi:phosphoenolpyruvate carboxykinase (ATP)
MLGYTCKIVGTEQGVSHPEKTFSSCFAEPFITHHPEIYGDLLEEKIKKHNTNVWLLNTGWLKNGNRMDLNTTRSIVNMISNGFNMGEFKQHKQFNFSVPISLPNVETNYLQPELNWNSIDEYEKEASNIHEEFCVEFEIKFGSK